MTPGAITFVSAGTLQGIYRPQVRIYYSNAKHGICFETITKPLRCRSRKRAIQVAKEWAKTAEFAAILASVRDRISSNLDNQI